MTRRTVPTLVVAFGVATLGVASAAQSARMPDKEVKALMETIDKDVERFIKAMAPEYRKATIRSATGEVDVGAYLKDLEDHVKKMKTRFGSKYSASTEVLAFLRHTDPIRARHARGAALFGGAAEWPRLDGDVARLSAEYGIRWGTDPDAWQARRVSTDELMQELGSLGRTVKDFRKALENAAKQAGVAKSESKAVLDTVKRMEKVAKDIEKAVGKGADATGALALFGSSMDEAKRFVDERGLSAAVASSWGPVDEHWGEVRSALRSSGS